MATLKIDEHSGAYHDGYGSTSYGFIDLPSLFIFFDPFSPHDAVRNFLLNGRPSWQAAQALSAKLDEVARRDLALRLTAVGHEIQHFQDIIATPFGSYLLREHLRLGFMAGIFFGRLVAGVRGGRKIRVPLDPERFSDSAAVERLLNQAAYCRQIRDIGRWTLEASAVLTQRVAAYDIFKADELDLVDQQLLTGEDHYHKISTLMDWAAGRWHKGESDLFLTFRRLLYFALCFRAPDKVLFSALELLIADVDDDNTARGALTNLLKDWLKIARGQDNEDRRQNETFLSRVIPSELEDIGLVRTAQKLFQNFTLHSYAARDYWLSNSDSFFHPHSQVTLKKLPSPRVYYYPADPQFAVWPIPKRIRKNELEEFEIWEDRGVAVPRVIIGTHVPFWRRQLTPQLWIDAAKGFSAPIALTRNLNWRHPLYGFWMRLVNRQYGIEFDG